MVAYTQESLQALRDKIDLVDVLSSHIDLKRSGSHYKAVCPFHNEKTPSFTVQKSDKHYHCFGCGAHGDAIAFMMEYLNMSFLEAVDALAERFDVPLEKIEGKVDKNKNNLPALKDVLNKAARFFHFYLLHTDEGHKALEYLYQRGMDLEFIKLFSIGYAPKNERLFFQMMDHYGISDDYLNMTGLIKSRTPKKAFFHSRVTIPIHDSFGNVIGFSCRKVEEQDFGPKYINTPETPLFKKSKILFGLRDCRREIAKRKEVILVEGQLDALRLIQEGYAYTLSPGGTAFGEDHVNELLHLGISKAFIAFDGDEAGVNAAVKSGHLLQKKGVEVFIVQFPKGKDPDSILLEEGPKALGTYLDNSQEYLPFLVGYYAKTMNPNSPAGKNEMVKTITALIKQWDHPLMIHEALKKLADLCQVPQELMTPHLPNIQIQHSRYIDKKKLSIDPDKILEMHLLRIMLLQAYKDSKIYLLITENIKKDHFKIEICAKLFSLVKEGVEKCGKIDLISFAIELKEIQLQEFFSQIMQKHYKDEKVENAAYQLIKKVLERNWMDEREVIRSEIQSGRYSEDEILKLAKKFDQLKSNPPVIHEV